MISSVRLEAPERIKQMRIAGCTAEQISSLYSRFILARKKGVYGPRPAMSLSLLCAGAFLKLLP